jgi:hypothetical protein
VQLHQAPLPLPLLLPLLPAVVVWMVQQRLQRVPASVRALPELQLAASLQPRQFQLLPASFLCLPAKHWWAPAQSALPSLHPQLRLQRRP